MKTYVCPCGREFEKRQALGGHSRHCGDRLEVDKRIANYIKAGVWVGPVNNCGYGKLTIGNVAVYAHRIVWEQAYGPIPEGLEIDHLCGVRECVTVEHMELVTRAENMRRVGKAQDLH